MLEAEVEAKILACGQVWPRGLNVTCNDFILLKESGHRWKKLYNQ